MTTTNLDGFLGKLEVTNEIGEALDKQLQHAEDQAQQLFGGCAALKVGAAKVGALGEHVSKDLDEGKLQFESELAAAEYVKTYLRRASEVLLNLAERSKSDELVAHGKASAIRNNMELVGRHCKSARARAEQLVAAAQEAEDIAKGKAPEPPEDGPRGPRAPGERPGRSSLDERRAEAAAARAKEGPNGSGTQAAIPMKPPVKKITKKKTKKKVKKKVARKAPAAARAAPQG